MKRFIAGLISVCFLAAAAVAAAPETFTIDKCQKKKPAVVFPHKKHIDMKIPCTRCHHKFEGKGEPQPCFKCHACTKGKAPSAKHAFHKNCIKCHKKEKKGPRRCKECHKK